MEITIRRATEKDISGVVDCLTEAFQEYRESYTVDAFNDTVPTIEGMERRSKEMKILIAEDRSSRIIGTVSYRVYSRSEGHLRGMAVLPRFQGKGSAKRLLEAVETELKQLGCSRITLDTTLPLQRATRFYLKHGFKPTGITRDFFGMPVFEYEKVLKRGEFTQKGRDGENE